MASVPQLLDDLCEALLPAAKAPLGQRGVSRQRAKQSLKRVAYNALFTGLFQDETRRLQPDLAKLPVKNKVLMLSFDLRVGGLGPEADRLEELVEELLAAPCGPLVEVGSVLDLLVQLAGSGPPPVLRRKRDYFWNNRHVGRNVPYGGYDCYDLSVFESEVQSLISREEYLCQDMIREALQLMEAAPGAGLPTTGLFSYGDPCSDRFERDTRVSLFGALVHSRTYDMDVRLDLPPVPDSADLSGLAIKVECVFPASSSPAAGSASFDLPLAMLNVGSHSSPCHLVAELWRGRAAGLGFTWVGGDPAVHLQTRAACCFHLLTGVWSGPFLCSLGLLFTFDCKEVAGSAVCQVLSSHAQRNPPAVCAVLCPFLHL